MSQTASHGKSKDEEDLQERSTKKFKDNSLQDMEGVVLMDTRETNNGDDNVRAAADIPMTQSYKGVVVGMDGRMDEEVVIGSSDSDDDDDDVLEEIDVEGIRVEDQKVGNYDCPIFVLSKAEEKRIHKPWKRGVIVKLLGRRIGYKALETRLKQMWVKKGIINIIDLGNDYYLVTFSHDFDHGTALMNGPWFIYDHYLTVKEWSPDFHPQSDTIKKVAVWVRISGLPIEYYDSRVLKHIGNKIGSTVKVDKNTLMQERGKYARICVEVDLSKSLLAMFMIKGRKYNVEYEGLHLLCKNCGKFGHYSEGCPEKIKVTNGHQEVIENGGRNNGGGDAPGSNLDGPWMVVQKQKRIRKGKEKENTMSEGGGRKGPAKFNAAGSINGSRFVALMDDNVEDIQQNANHAQTVVKPVLEEHVANESANGYGRNNQNNDTINSHKKKSAGSGKNNLVIIANQGTGASCAEKEDNVGLSWQQKEGNQEKSLKPVKLGARVTESFKGKSTSKNNGRATLDHLVENIEKNKLANLVKEQIRQPRESGDKEGIVMDGRGFNFQEMGLHVGLPLKGAPNVPRPPDFQNVPPFINTPPPVQATDDINQEKENFLDASDQVGEGSSDSDMEVVKETPLGDA
ncbi:zinc ion binding / nucleic acid binding protein [Trifolium repens]|nr:zinc ion binding / nucleic acid binding protein [Trifolium repens]KAK2453862.1 zinc ion binding / nucleic acid binding protein [Trifolium repens]